MVLLILIGPLGPTGPAQEKSQPPKPDLADSADYWFTHVAPKQRRIEAELEKGGPLEPWEGDFANKRLHGPQPGWVISRKEGYASTGRFADIGTVEVKGTRIVLKSASTKMWAPDWPVYEVVKWCERRSRSAAPAG